MGSGAADGGLGVWIGIGKRDEQLFEIGMEQDSRLPVQRDGTATQRKDSPPHVVHSQQDAPYNTRW